MHETSRSGREIKGGGGIPSCVSSGEAIIEQMREIRVGLLKFLELRRLHEHHRARGGGERVPNVVKKIDL